MKCQRCGRHVAIENKDLGLCATCNKDLRNDEDLYPTVRTMFLELMVKLDATCPITGEPITMKSDIHHKWGRVGYASADKRKKGISLLIDVDFFLAVSRVGHTWIENNREIAIRRGYTLPRSGTHNP